MSSSLRILVAAALAACAAFARPAGAQSLAPVELKLDNGMKVLLLKREGDPTVAAGWVAKVGSVNERPGITGLAHLFEHMMFKGSHVIGTKDYAKDVKLMAEQDALRAELRIVQDDLDRKVRLGLVKPEDAKDPSKRSAQHAALLDKWAALVEQEKANIIESHFDQIYQAQGGGGMNAFTQQDRTVYFINVPANKLELWFWMESDRLIQPVFRQFYTERDVVWEERRMRTDSTPTGKLDEQFETMFWRASPYNWPVIGWPSDLDSITREEAEDFFCRNYSPNNLTAALVGDFDIEQAKVLAQRYFGRIKRCPEPPTAVRTFEPEQQAEQRLEGEAETKPQVSIRWPAVPYGHADAPALDVLSDILNGQTGRLYKSLVLEQKVATDASAGLGAQLYGGLFDVSATAAPGRSVEELEPALLAEVKKLQTELVGERELQKVKNNTLAGNFRRFSGNFFVMLQLLIYDSSADWRDINTEAGKLLAVTPADIKRVANEYFVDSRRNVGVYRTKAVAGAPEPADPLFDALPEPVKQMANGAKKQLGAITDPAQLEEQLTAMQAQKGQAPPEAAPFFTWLESWITRRIATLKGGAS